MTTSGTHLIQHQATEALNIATKSQVQNMSRLLLEPRTSVPDSLSSRPIVYPGLGVGRWFVPFCQLLLDLKNADKDFPNH